MFQKIFNGYIFYFLGQLFSGQLFELFARETNLKKQSSVLRRRPDSNEKFDLEMFITYNLLSNFLKILNHQSVVVVHLQVILLAKIR